MTRSTSCGNPECHLDRERKMVVIERDRSGKPAIWCDPCIAPIVRALNNAGIRTVASCCGHGFRPGTIALADGRELLIARDWEEARAVDAAFPVDINGAGRRALQEERG
ncbi:hypothetical protein [Nitratireductor sp. GCM10026969]|uniref:hypothetical protein n=1 Tax=Nitratireductor sp. GCM10026969 TaxID=3252645 RepID=UPI00361FA2D9